jgi:hypothetical protein
MVLSQTIGERSALANRLANQQRARGNQGRELIESKRGGQRVIEHVCH